MRYSSFSAAILAFATSVLAVDPTANFDPITVPTQDQNVAAGSTLNIKWQPSTVHTGPVTIALLQGASPSTLDVGQTIAAGIDQTTGSFSWAVPSNLKSFATYGFSITLDSSKADPTKVIFQYSFPFHITGLSASSSSSSSTGSTTTVQLSTGPSYSATPMSSSSTSTSASSSASVTSTSSSSVVSTSAKSTSTVVAPTTSASGNSTVQTTLKPSTSTSSAASSTTSGTASTSAASVPASSANNLARGGVAVIGGLVLALAL